MRLALKGEIRDVMRWSEATDGSPNLFGWYVGTQILSAFKKWWEMFAGKWTVNGFKVMGEGVNNYVRTTGILTISFHIYYIIIIPFKVGNIFPKILMFSFKTAINW